ncbi:hypothetical protein FXO38_23111 [Capsicum annuum]|nr:hypothetical protein FXO38_23111 [Capsicum annuum]
MSYPCEEGGVGFKRIHDICNAFTAKKWRRFRVEDNLWTRFLKVKVTMGQKFSPMDWCWNWIKICQVMECYKTNLKSIMVKWEKPEMDSWKLNTDGSNIANQGRAGAGGVVRNRDGQMLMAFAAPVQFLTNNYSETQAALHGII